MATSKKARRAERRARNMRAKAARLAALYGWRGIKVDGEGRVTLRR